MLDEPEAWEAGLCESAASELGNSSRRDPCSLDDPCSSAQKVDDDNNDDDDNDDDDEDLPLPPLKFDDGPTPPKKRCRRNAIRPFSATQRAARNVADTHVLEEAAEASGRQLSTEEILLAGLHDQFKSLKARPAVRFASLSSPCKTSGGVCELGAEREVSSTPASQEI